MSDRPPDPAAFYATRLGRTAAALLGDALVRLWQDTPGLAVLGIGYPLPFLPGLATRAERVLAALLPAGAAPDEWRGRVCRVAGTSLPFADRAFDRVLMIHAIERASDPPRLLREVWRVLRDGGRLLLVAPNRLGAWAHVEATPFGHGTPLSRGEVDRLLGDLAFSVAQRDGALYAPPLPGRTSLRGARAVEAAGRAALPLLGGVTLTEAIKEVAGVHPLLAGAPARARRPRRVLADAG